MNLDKINNSDSKIGQIKTHNAIHVQVKVVKLDFVGVGTRHIDRNNQVIPILVLNFSFLFLYDCADYTEKSDQTSCVKWEDAPIFGYFLLNHLNNAGTPFGKYEGQRRRTYKKNLYIPC